MPTKLFLKQQFNGAVGVSGSVAPYQYASLARSVLAFVTAVTNTTASGSNIQMTKTAGGVSIAFVSPPFARGFIMSGTAIMNLWALESSLLANATIQVRFIKYSGGSEGAAFFTSSFGTELGTSAAACNWTGTVSAQPFAAGDRLVIKIDGTNATSLTMGGSQTVTLDYAGPTVSADGDSWISIPADVSYSSSFPNTETPLSDGGKWMNGQTDGLDFNDCVSTPGFVGGKPPALVQYTDPTAVLNPAVTGPWGPSQYARGTVFSTGIDATKYKEVELRLNTTITNHSIVGYEVDFGVHLSPIFAGGPTIGVAIIRWNGPPANIDALGSNNNKGYTDITSWSDPTSTGVVDGDVVEAMNIDGVISAFVNGKLVCQGVDITYRDGSSGVGFNAQCDPLYATFGFKDFLAENIPFQTEPEFIQFVHATSFVTGNTLVATLPGVTAAGNLLVMEAFVVTDNVVSIATDKIDTITGLPGNPTVWSADPLKESFWCVQGTKGGSATATTLIKSTTAADMGLNVGEYSGAVILDVSTTPATGDGTAMASATPGATNFAMELIVGMEDDANGTSVTPATDFLNRSGAADNILLDKTVTAIGVYPASATVNNTGVWVMMVATFKCRSQSFLEQSDFRFRNDNGSETGATSIAAQNTNITRNQLTNTRLRVVTNGAGDPTSDQFQIEYRKKGGSEQWHKIS